MGVAHGFGAFDASGSAWPLVLNSVRLLRAPIRDHETQTSFYRSYLAFFLTGASINSSSSTSMAAVVAAPLPRVVRRVAGAAVADSLPVDFL